MIKKLIVSTLFFALLLGSFSSCRSQNLPDRTAYAIYDSKGRKVGYREMIRAAAGSDVLLFGELHNDPISHWLERCIAEDLYNIKKDKLVIGAEMWEADDQLILDEYLKQHRIDLQTYVENSRLWPNFATDYLPVLAFADENGIRFVATNVPRRYARMVSKVGLGVLDSLDKAACQYLPPLPVEVDYDEGVYVYIGESFKQMGGMPMKKSDVRNLVDAQALKDATMACFIVRNRKPGDLFFHFHGELHSAFRSGIAHYIRQYAPQTRIVTVSVHEAEDPASFRPRPDRADFNIVVPANMTKTYVD